MVLAVKSWGFDCNLITQFLDCRDGVCCQGGGVCDLGESKRIGADRVNHIPAVITAN